MPSLFELAFGKRPREELYDCRKDPYQLHNLASDPAQQATLQELSARLTAHLKATGDPRETTGETPWDNWPYYGNNRWKILPEQAADVKTDALGKARKTTHFDPVVQPFVRAELKEHGPLLHDLLEEIWGPMK